MPYPQPQPPTQFPPERAGAARDRRVVVLVVVGALVVALLAVLGALWAAGAFGGDRSGDDARPVAETTVAETTVADEPGATTEESAPEGTAPGEGTATMSAAPLASDEATPAYLMVGDPAAPTTIEVYVDYLCPHCAQFAAEVEPGIIAELVDSGQANLVFHDVAFVDPAASRLLAIAARAAGEQGHYAEFHEAAMAAQADIRAAGSLEIDDVLALAATAGVPDLELFEQHLDSADLAAGLDASIAESSTRGITGVPTVHVDGEPVDADLASVRSAVEQAG